MHVTRRANPLGRRPRRRCGALRDRPLGDEELAFLLSRHWRRLGLTLNVSDFTDARAVAVVGRITRGNFRLVHHLFVQIERVLRIKGLTGIASDVVETPTAPSSSATRSAAGSPAHTDEGHMSRQSVPVPQRSFQSSDRRVEPLLRSVIPVGCRPWMRGTGSRRS